jgi:hypothetical protein
MEKALKKLEDTSGLSADTKREIMMQGDEALELYYKRIQEFEPKVHKDEFPTYDGTMNCAWFS